MFIVSAVGYYPIFALVCLGSCILACWWFAKSSRRVTSQIASVDGVLFCGILLYGAVGFYGYVQDFAKTLEYVNKAVPILDTVKAETGKYPATLPDALLGPPEGLLRSDAYKSDGDLYYFAFWDRLTLWSIWEFLSDEREWRTSHSRRRETSRFSELKVP